MIEMRNVFHSSQMDNCNLLQVSQNVPQTDKSKSDVYNPKMIPQNQVSNHMKDSTNTDNNRFPNTKPKVQQVANHLTNY